jgi:predicted ribosome quality control (RQC) complex YloA/Tae2 family protein
MTFDAITLAALRQELEALCLGGRVQRIVRPTDLTVGIEIFAHRRYDLVLSAEPDAAGIYMPADKPRRGTEKPSPLQLLLRKHVRGSRLVDVTQPDLERVLCLGFEGPLGRVELICEIMGRLSNLILVSAENTVLEAAKRVPASVNRYRTILPRHPYVAPPPQKKQDPRQVTAPELCALLGAGQGPIWRRLVDGVGAISPLLAREVVYRATGDWRSEAALDLEDCQSIVGLLHGLLAADARFAGAWLGFETRDGVRRAVEFAPYELSHLPDREPAADLFAAIEQVQASKGPADAYRQVRRRLLALVGEQVAKQRARLVSLRKALVPPEELETLQLQGTAILSLAWAIRPGQDLLRVDLSELGLPFGEGVVAQQQITLDPEVSPAESAQKLFREYRRLQSAGEQVPTLIAGGERELAYLHQLEADIELAEDRPQLDEVEAALVAAGYVRRPAKRAKTTGSAPLRRHSADGTLILVGRNSQQNELVTFHLASGDDLWLHAHGVPGSHVIVRSGGGAVSEQTLQLAAQVAAYYSRSRADGRVQVDYAPRRYVHPVKGGRPGMVTYTHEEKCVVEPRCPNPDGELGSDA